MLQKALRRSFISFLIISSILYSYSITGVQQLTFAEIGISKMVVGFGHMKRNETFNITKGQYKINCTLYVNGSGSTTISINKETKNEEIQKNRSIYSVSFTLDLQESNNIMVEIEDYKLFDGNLTLYSNSTLYLERNEPINGKKISLPDRNILRGTLFTIFVFGICIAFIGRWRKGKKEGEEIEEEGENEEDIVVL